MRGDCCGAIWRLCSRARVVLFCFVLFCFVLLVVVVEPSLAVSWTITDVKGGDQLYVFKLRQGVTFHDGAAWNCAVAKLNFDHVLSPALTTGDFHGWYVLPEVVKNWDCLDEYTFAFETTGIHYPVLQELSYIRPLRMLSPTMFKGGLKSDRTTQNSCPAKWGSAKGNGDEVKCVGTTGVSGTGPWKFSGRVKADDGGDKEATFVRNEKHWGYVPKLESLKVVRYSSHAEVKAALLNGTLDVVVGDGVLEASDLAAFKKGDLFSVHLGPVLSNRLIILNGAKGATKKLAVRQAIIQAIDKQSIIDKELAGLAKPVDTLFPKNAPYCNIDSSWEYNLAKATELNCPAALPLPDSTTSPVLFQGVVRCRVCVLFRFCLS